MQGPPGTGKTYTAAEQILELIAHGRTVGITGPSHAVICHLLDIAYEHARWRGAGPPRIGQRAERDNPHRHADAATMSNEQLEKALRDGELGVATGTAWLARVPVDDREEGVQPSPAAFGEVTRDEPLEGPVEDHLGHATTLYLRARLPCVSTHPPC